MTFKTLRKDVYERCHLSTEFFAELVEVEPLGAAPRSITAHVDEEISERGPGDDIDEIFERVLVLVGRDESATVGGLARPPKIGSKLTRATDVDPIGLPYRFTGEIQDTRPDKWRLIFERVRRISEGAAR